ncbi:hypothetical protein N7E81_09560 [Reichenbachiella carrageenanivorans]|uniref:Uncharacterized protein n=1 Tax=Reichenbachiella carrageenanivorans TaxID=2979869 RepID=A0ABY6CW98_9BACT|nr:hypothetical protein [Reichenbachiella carrageenanivorans]UXX77614.1 hypothetical protein N7E81_09560 [Reichenbachiella carrageenanivorans]
MQKSFILVLSIISCCAFHSSFAQKKYKYDKDIFPLIEAKNYDQAIPMLWEYLSDPKNAEEPNANLQIGLYYEGLVNDYHIVSDSTAILGATDTAVVYLTKAKAYITEKELKKNDEFYQAFYRRDLRTGDFGIKISDVQLDIEKKLQSLRNINKYAKSIYADLYSVNAANAYSLAAYKAFAANYPDIKNLYMMATQETEDSLVVILDKNTEIKEKFEKVRDAVSRIGKKGYSPELEFKKIEAYGEDGMTSVDFFANDVVAWNYGDWAYEVEDVIRKDVSTLKNKIITINEELKTQGEKINSGSGILDAPIVTSLDADLISAINDYDSNSLGLDLLSILINKNKFDYLTSEVLNERLADSEDVDYQLAVSDSLMQLINLMDASVATLVEPGITVGAKKYPKLVNDSYGGEMGLIKYRKGLETQLASARSKWLAYNEQYRLRARWGVSADGADSLYLIPRMDSTFVPHDFSKFYSIVSMKDDSSNTYVVGLEFQGASDQGFVAKVNNARNIVWKKNFALTGFEYSDSEFLVNGKFVPTQAGSIAVYIFSLVPSSKNNIITVSVTPGGNTNWVNQLKISRAPVDVKFNDIVKETIFYTKTEAELESGGGDPNDPGYFVVDRSGNVR